MQSIWILNHYAHSNSGRHYQFARHLFQKGYNVTLFAASTRHGTGENQIKDSRKYVVDRCNLFPCVYVRTRNYRGNEFRRILNMLDYAWRVLGVSKRLNLKKPDVIYASSVHPLTWLSGYFLAKRYRAKFVAETRDLWPETLIAMGRIKKGSIPAKVLYALERFVYKKADRLVFTFPGGKDYIEGLGFDTNKVAYINNGVDLEEFDRNQRTYVYDDVDLDRGCTFKVIYAGSMGQANALRYLIEAAGIIQTRGLEKIRFILFGDGYQKEELEYTAKDKGLKNVIFKGRVDKKYIPNILLKSDLNIFTGQHIYLYKYGLSLNKMFEYFASGKPTLSNIECGYDLLEQYQCGITVAGGSAITLADGIIHFFEMGREDYQRYCANARLAAQDFDFKVLTDKLEEVIVN